jgi:nucleotide-binding universal stress UspA family protein
MYTKILVPLDGSQLSEGILPYARSFAKSLKVPVELMQVIDPQTVPAISDPQVGRYVDAVEADMKRNIINYLKSIAGSFQHPSTVNRSVEIGNPAEIIVDKAAAHSGTLIAMATHGRSGIQRWLLGSVAYKVLHAATNPLLLMRATEKSETSNEAPLKKILVPLDGSSLAELVLPHVVALAKELNLEVVLLQAYSVPAHMGVGFSPELDPARENVRQDARNYLEGKVWRLQGEGLSKVPYMLVEGDAATQIIDIARETPDNMLAMCTHGKSGIGRWVLGGVTDRVVCHSGDPVLVIRSSAQTYS